MIIAMSRREYEINIVINGRRVTNVIIDPHYEEKHGESITVEIIVELVKKLDGQNVFPDERNPPFSYFTTDRMELKGKFYKLIWLLEDDEIYIGVVNAYRR
jgi:hypothetical protein